MTMIIMVVTVQSLAIYPFLFSWFLEMGSNVVDFWGFLCGWGIVWGSVLWGQASKVFWVAADVGWDSLLRFFVTFWMNWRVWCFSPKKTPVSLDRSVIRLLTWAWGIHIRALGLSGVSFPLYFLLLKHIGIRVGIWWLWLLSWLLYWRMGTWRCSWVSIAGRAKCQERKEGEKGGRNEQADGTKQIDVMIREVGCGWCMHNAWILRRLLWFVFNLLTEFFQDWLYALSCAQVRGENAWWIGGVGSSGEHVTN